MGRNGGRRICEEIREKYEKIIKKEEKKGR